MAWPCLRFLFFKFTQAEIHHDWGIYSCLMSLNTQTTHPTGQAEDPPEPAQTGPKRLKAGHLAAVRNHGESALQNIAFCSG